LNKLNLSNAFDCLYVFAQVFSYDLIGSNQSSSKSFLSSLLLVIMYSIPAFLQKHD